MSNNLSLNSNKNNSLNKNFNRNNSNNYNRRNSGGSNKKTLMVLAIGFVIILLVFAIVMIVIHVKTKVKGGGPDHREKILQKLIHDCNNDPLLVKHVPASSDFNEYSLSFWLYVKNTEATIISQGTKREIITKGKVIGGVIEESTENELDIYMEEGESTLKLFFGFNKAEGSIQDPGCVIADEYLAPEPTPSNEDVIDTNGEVVDKEKYKTFEECKESNKDKAYFGMVDYRYYKKDNREIAVSRCIADNYMIGNKKFDSTVRSPLCKGQSKNNESVEPNVTREKTGPINMGSENYMYVSSTSSNQSQKPCELKLMPLEKWNHITINVHGNICDLFFDGKLYRTCVLSAPPILNNNPIIIGNRGGFNGYVSNVVWSNKALNPGDIHQRYLRGPRLRLTFRERLTYFFSPNKKSKILQEHESEQAQLEEEQKSQSRV